MLNIEGYIHSANIQKMDGHDIYIPKYAHSWISLQNILNINGVLYKHAKFVNC